MMVTGEKRDQEICFTAESDRRLQALIRIERPCPLIRDDNCEYRLLRADGALMKRLVINIQDIRLCLIRAKFI